MEREQALRIVYETIDVVNQQLPAPRRLRKGPDTVIIGVAGSLDSLGIVNFIVTLEEKAGELLGTPIQLLDDTMLVETDSPFRTVATLTSYLETNAGG
jgi:acyl carrier protein